jgi:hypothetical protein
LTRIGKVYPKDWESAVRVRRQQVCENGRWTYAVFERKAGTWVRII